MSSSSLGERTSTGWGVAIESGLPVPQITGSAKARPFRGGLIFRLLASGTRNRNRDASIHQVANIFPPKKLDALVNKKKSEIAWYRFAIANVSTGLVADFTLGPPPVAVSPFLDE
jgi:hypothetical protein